MPVDREMSLNERQKRNLNRMMNSVSYRKRQISHEVNRLFAVYRSHINMQPMAGGAQNLVLKRCCHADQNGSQQGKLFQFNQKTANNSGKQNFNDLPIQIKLFIFSYLTPKDLCTICQVCEEWFVLANDEHLWKQILLRGLKVWDRIYDDRNPDFYKRVCAGLPSKQIYLKCHPESPSPSLIRIPNLLHYLVSARPRVVMFGPGLETKTSKLVRSILTDQHVNEASRFKVTGMVPGEFAGVGSGISLKFSDYTFNLVTLYSNVKSVRQRLSAENRVQQNKLFIHEQRNRFGEDHSTAMYEVTPSIQELCRRSAAFVYVVDATKNVEEISLCQTELFAMLCELWASTQAPLLVLACSRGTWSPSYHDAEPLPPIEIVRALRLGRLKRRWMVQTGEVETLHGIRSGMKWLLAHIGF